MEIEQFFDKIIDSFRKEKTVDDRIAMRALYSEIQGLFYMHVGYGPVMDSDNPEKVRKRGYGEYGRIYELYYINEGRLTRGLAAMDVPFYMQRLWDDDADNDGKSDSWISGMFNLSLRDGGKLVCDVVGAVNPALGMVFTAFDSMTFAALDMGFTGKSFGEAAADVGKRMAMSGVNWATKGIGSGASTGIAATTARAVATKYVTNVAESAVEATFTDQDYAGAYWDTASFSENYNSYISAGISAGLGEGAGVAYDLAVTGETKLNAFGMVEMNIGGSDGFSANWGTDGHNARAVVSSTIGYLDSLGMVMSGWHTAEDNTQNGNRLTLLSTAGETLGKNLTEKEMAELLAAQEEARRIAEEKEQEEKDFYENEHQGVIKPEPEDITKIAAYIDTVTEQNYQEIIMKYNQNHNSGNSINIDILSVLFLDPDKSKALLMENESLHKDLRYQLNDKVPITKSNAQSMGYIKLPWYKALLHNPVKNDKLISPDGHMEGVYNKRTGRLVTSKKYMGTFNFFDPVTQPIPHGKADLDTYFKWGN